MKVTVFGVGYVGLVQGTILAEVGHDVVCVDVDKKRIENLNQGIIPIYEPGLSPLVLKNQELKRLFFTTDALEGVKHGEFIFIAVGTPPDEDGSADLKYVKEVAKTIAIHMGDSKIIIDKSTVPVGTADQVQRVIAEQLHDLGKEISFDVVSNPEFLKEGAAVLDCMEPDRIVVGTNSLHATKRMKALYAPFLDEKDRFIEMDIRSAELTKYAANCMLATKISFMNEIANLADLLDADVEMVRQGIGMDSRIGFHFINPGCGYGGSCFPKDVQALICSAKERGYKSEILHAVELVNQRQKKKLFQMISKHYAGNLAGKKFALWGLSFKPNTDDMREAPSRVLLEALWNAGANVQVFDPEAMGEARRIYGERLGLKLTENKEEALKGADALIVCTEWKEFKGAHLLEIKKLLKSPVIFDGRNICNLEKVKELNIIYYGVGRKASIT